MAPADKAPVQAEEQAPCFANGTKVIFLRTYGGPIAAVVKAYVSTTAGGKYTLILDNGAEVTAEQAKVSLPASAPASTPPASALASTPPEQPSFAIFAAGTRVIVARAYGSPRLAVVDSYDAAAGKYTLNLGARGELAQIQAATEKVTLADPAEVTLEVTA